MRLTYGELFAGYGGLGMGVQSVLGGDMAWCAEYEAAPSAILAHHWPDVPNLGDVTKIDWTTVPKVDVITGGSPCQDLSHAGKRAGMKAGTRSGLWASMCDAIEIIRPRLVVWENVRGALSAEADSAMEPCPGCVGGADDGPVLRALGRVLGDLAELGYDARWYGLRAADVGAPHGRFRIFVFATDARRGSLARIGSAGHGLRLTTERGPLAAPDAGRERHGRGEDGRALGRVDGDNAGQAWERERSREVPGDRSPAATPDADSRGQQGEWQSEPRGIEGARGGLADGCGAVRELDDTARYPDDRERVMGYLSHGNTSESRPDQALRDVRGVDDSKAVLGEIGSRTDASGTLIDPDHALSELPSQAPLERGPREADGSGHEGTGDAPTDWGQYAPAIRRWEMVLGRVAPAPTEIGPKGERRLSPLFVEFLMGLPAGHVTDVDISRNDQLKALGNGVVPQQSAEATRRFLLDAMEAAA